MTAAPPDIEHDAIAVETGPGKLLHEARLAAKLSVLDVAAQLHLDAATIDALERDDYTKLPAPAFVRGYLRSYARLVKLAPDPVVEAYSTQGFEPPALVADISSGTQAQGESSDLPWRLMTWLIAGVVVALVVMWWRGNMSDPFSVLDDMVGISEPAPATGSVADTSLTYRAVEEISPPGDPVMAPEADVASATSAVAVDTTPPVADTSTSFQSVVVPATPIDGAPDALSAVPAIDEAASSPAETVASDAAATVEAPPPATPPAADEAMPTIDTPTLADEAVARAPTDTSLAPPPVTGPPGTLALAFTHDSWVEVYDGGGDRLFFGMARAGRDMNLSGSPPLKVLLGYARGIRVEYNGRIIDYEPFASRGIARFTITADGVRGELVSNGDATASQQ